MVVLSPQALAFSVVLGLDFVFFTDMQIDAAWGSYWFRGETGRYSLHVKYAAQRSHLEGEMKERLREMLQYNNDVCTNKVGSTDLITRKTFLTDDVLIKKKSYHL